MINYFLNFFLTPVCAVCTFKIILYLTRERYYLHSDVRLLPMHDNKMTGISKDNSYQEILISCSYLQVT